MAGSRDPLFQSSVFHRSLVKREDFLSLLLLILATLIFYYKEIFLGKVIYPADIAYNFVHPWASTNNGRIPVWNPNLADYNFQYYPYWHFTVATLRMFELPLWNPFIFSGVPFVGNDQSAIFFPLNFVAYLLPIPIATTIIFFLKTLIASWGMYALLRRMGVNCLGRLVGSLAFSFSGFMVVWLIYPLTNVAMWLPLLFLFADRLVCDRKLQDALILSLLVAVQFLGGHVEMSIFALSAVTFYVVSLGVLKFQSPLSFAKLLVTYFSAIGIGTLESAVQLLPTYEYVQNSYRLYVLETSSAFRGMLAGGLPIQSLVAMMFPLIFGPPDAYRGPVNFTETNMAYLPAVTIILAVVGLVHRWKDRRVASFSLLAFLAVAITYGLVGINTAITRLPFFNEIAIHRAIVIWSFSVSVLAGFGASGVSTLAKRGRIVSLILSLAFVVLVGAAALSYYSPRSPLELVDAAVRTDILDLMRLVAAVGLLGVLLWMRGRLKRTRLLGVIIIAVLLADAFSFGVQYNTAVDQELLPKPTGAIEFLRNDSGIFRIVGTQFSVMTPNSMMQFGISDIRGYDGISPRTFTALRLLEANPQGGWGVWPLAVDNLTSPLLDLFNVKYVVDGPGGTVPDMPSHTKPGVRRFTLVYDGKDARIWKNEDFLPRAFVVHNFISGSSEENVLTLMKDLRDFRSTVVIQGLAEKSKPKVDETESHVDIPTYSPNLIRIEAKLSAPGFLVLSDQYFPGWKAFVNHTSTEIRQADYAFRAVYLLAGTYLVEFSYQPLSFTVGSVLSSLSIGLAAMLLIYIRGAQTRKPAVNSAGEMKRGIQRNPTRLLSRKSSMSAGDIPHEWRKWCDI